MARTAVMTDQDFIAAAMAATGLSARSLAQVLDVNERTVRRWIEGVRELSGPARQLCRVLIHDPSLVLVLALALGEAA